MVPAKSSQPVGIKTLLFPLGLALAGAAINRWFSLDLAFGITFLVGSPLGVLSALIAPWPFGIVGPLIALAPTLILWGHPWALTSVLLEGLIIAALARKRQLDRVILFEALYWLLAGAPLVLLQYVVFLGMRLDGALAAAAKQGVNAFYAAVFGVILYYATRAVLKTRFTSSRLPDAREYFTLFLETGIFLPVLIGVLLYTRDMKEQVLTHAERETSIILSIMASQDTDKAEENLAGVLGLSAHHASLLDKQGNVIWSTAGHPPLLYAGGSVMHSYGDTAVIGAEAERNPMKRWSDAIVRAEHEYADGKKLVVSQALTTQLADLNSRLTTIFGVLLMWLAAAAGVAFFTATLLVRPLERLRRVAEKVQRGEDEVVWPSFGILEIQELRDSLVAMTGSLDQRGIALAEAMKAAESMMKRGEKFLAFMGHELKAPLAALSTALAADSGGGLHVKPETMRESLSRLLELIDDILDQARSSTGTLILRSEPFDPAHEATNLLESFAIQARRNGLGFELHLDKALSTRVRGDPLRFRQVIANLVSNALKYTRSGKVSVRLEGHTFKDSLAVSGTVEDTGVGIEAGRQAAIWKPFSSTATQAPDGMSSHGLGLSIVRSIVDAMSGSIKLESLEGKGSVFTFELAFPLEATGLGGLQAKVEAGMARQSGVQADDSRSALADKPDLRGVRVLVADDERISRMAVGHFLRTWGATVDEVESGDRALEAFRATAYSVIILDEYMPGLGGRDVVKKIRAHESESGRRRSYLIISSAESGSFEDSVADARFGPDALLPKPVYQAALAAVLMKAEV